MSNYRIERLANGFIRVDGPGGLVGLYNADGSYRHGDLRRCEQIVRQWLRR
jgi:hypothetical protein